MSNIELYCKYADHQYQEINGVCVNEACDKQRPVCFFCMKNFHQSHPQDLLEYNKFEAWRQNGTAVTNNLKFAIDRLEQTAQMLRKLIKKQFFDANFNLTTSTIGDINNVVKQALKTITLNSLLSTDLSSLSELLKSIQIKCNKMKCENKEKLELIQQQQLLQPYSIQQQVQVQEKLIDKVMKTISFRFSQQDKHELFNMSEQGNIIASRASRSAFGVCVCDPVIPNISVTRVVFRIVKYFFGKICIGVCSRDIIKQANYDPCLSKLGHGSYLMYHNGYSSHHYQNMNSKQQPFNFDTNDIIIVEVNIENKKITWIKKDSNKTFTMQFNIQGDLNYCVGISSNGGSVEIMNEI